MSIQEITDGLRGLGFIDGYAIGGDPAEIILWENETKQPATAAIAKAAPNGAYMRELEACNESRRNAYTLESDPLFFKYQETLEEADRTAWLNKKAEIRERYPEPVKPETVK